MTPWLTEAYRHVGLAEVPGKGNNPTIQRWLRSLGAWWSDDATPWCGTFVAHCMDTAGIVKPRHWYRARAWLDWGVEQYEPHYGSVVVFERKGGGHVGFVVGIDQQDRLMVLGGNQGDRVSIAPFTHDRVLGYTWPTQYLSAMLEAPPLILSDAPSSSREA